MTAILTAKWGIPCLETACTPLFKRHMFSVSARAMERKGAGERASFTYHDRRSLGTHPQKRASACVYPTRPWVRNEMQGALSCKGLAFPGKNLFSGCVATRLICTSRRRSSICIGEGRDNSDFPPPVVKEQFRWRNVQPTPVCMEGSSDVSIPGAPRS
jgi:hypothetical protein